MVKKMGVTRKNQKALQVKVCKKEKCTWEYVFALNQRTGIVTTKNRKKSLHGENALKWFRQRRANNEFRITKQ